MPSSTASPFNRPTPTIIPPDAGERLGIVGDVARMIADERITGGQCTIFEAITSPGVGPPLHRHANEDEYFYVVRGTVKFSINGEIRIGTPGTLVVAPRESSHTFVNAGQEPSVMLIWVTPSGLEKAFRENAELFKRNPKATPAELSEIFGRAGVEFLGPPLSPTAS